jgi:hypothetical protein
VILGNAFFHAFDLFRVRLALMLRFPVGVGHAVDNFAALGFGKVSGFGDPIAEAIAAKSGKSHEVNILGVGAMLQMFDKAAEGGGGNFVVKTVDLHQFRPRGGIP